MKKIHYYAFIFFGLIFCSFKHSFDQTIADHLIIGGDDSQMGENKRLFFGGPAENGDPVYMSRYDRSPDQCDLRVSLGDDNNDRFVIGTRYWGDGLFHPYFVVQNGRVGIGTEAIGEERLAVNGRIRAKEVKVEAATWDTPWPDYVFEPNYQLTTLPELKRYLDKNKHLPDVPSEKEIAKDGIELGQMNKVLVKKVEELTLYLIKQQEQLDRQQKQIDRLTKN